MSRTQKKLEAHTAIPLQLPETSIEESAVKAADGYSSEGAMEKRKKEADKPIYLRRV
jgi:hypothetical protein